MNQFALFAALLGLVAVALVISPLWKGSRPLALALAIGLPLAAAALYHLTGEPAAIDAKVAKAANAAAAPEAASMSMSMEEAVAKLEQRVAAEPDNLEGVALLARSYMAMEKYQLARDAYAKAVKLSPDDTDLSVEYAESMVRTSPDHSFPRKRSRCSRRRWRKIPRTSVRCSSWARRECMTTSPPRLSPSGRSCCPNSSRR